MSASASEDGASKVVDMDELLRDYARGVFERVVQKGLEKRLDMKLQWELLTVTLDYSRFLLYTENFDPQAVQPVKKSGNIVFKTTFSNTTDSVLEYTLNTSRTTRNVTTFRINKGLTYSGSVGLKLKLPGDVFELEAGGSREFTMERERETTREEEITWSADTVVKVPKHTDTTLQLVVDENECDGSFQCLVKMSGTVVICIHKGEFEVYRIVVENFDDILTKTMGFVRDPKSKIFTYVIKGTWLYRKGIQQHIRLSETPHDHS